MSESDKHVGKVFTARHSFMIYGEDSRMSVHVSCGEILICIDKRFSGGHCYLTMMTGSGKIGTCGCGAQETLEKSGWGAFMQPVKM